MIGNILAGVYGELAPLGDYESIATTVLSTSTSSVTFSSIPSTFQHLQIRSMCFGSVNDENLRIRFNGDTGSNYARHYLEGNGTAASASATTSDSGGVFSNTSSGTSPYVAVTDILDYLNTNKYTTLRSLSGRDSNGSGFIYFRSSLWMNTAAINEITILPGSGTLSSGSHFALYGIKG